MTNISIERFNHINSKPKFIFFFPVQFLRSLASLGNVKRILELGMFTGCTALAFAESIPEDGQVVTCELDPYIADTARSFLDKSGCGKKIEIMKGKVR